MKTPKLTESDIRSQVAADESARPYPEDYYLYRAKLHTAPEWYRQTYGKNGLPYFKLWLDSKRNKEGISRAKKFRLGVPIGGDQVVYDDREWAVIDEAWKKRNEWGGV